MAQTHVDLRSELKDEHEDPSPSASQHPVVRVGLLKKVGGASALVVVGAAGAATWRAVDQGVFSTNQGPAYDAWRAWNDQAGGVPLNCVRAAALAASAHNSQPRPIRIATS